MSKFHFGYEKNERVCSLGCHLGCGDITPMERAARAARMRDTMPSLMPQTMTDFLADWEAHHGAVSYSMQSIGANSGHFIPANKGQPLKGAVFVDKTIMPQRKFYND